MNKCECQPLLAPNCSSHSAYFRSCASLRWGNYKHTPLRDSVRETTQRRGRWLRSTPRKAAFAQECHCAWWICCSCSLDSFSITKITLPFSFRMVCLWLWLECKQVKSDRSDVQLSSMKLWNSNQVLRRIVALALEPIHAIVFIKWMSSCFLCLFEGVTAQNRPRTVNQDNVKVKPPDICFCLI